MSGGTQLVDLSDVYDLLKHVPKTVREQMRLVMDEIKEKSKALVSGGIQLVDLS
ncbi:hypothetical protein L218DRAFT_962598 [Marasmius fiardii PR-910]|nr:hypothetical protein L218DRAFT_962598 [Marasmius fiardii PR-910]